MTILGGHEQRRGSIFHRLVGINAWHREQPLHHRVVTILGSQEQRHGALVRHQVGIGACCEQPLHHRQMSIRRRQRQGGLAARVHGI